MGEFPMLKIFTDRALALVFLVLGLVGLYFGCRMSYAFGKNMSTDHAIFLGLVAVLAAFVLPARDILKERNKHNLANWAGWFGAIMILIEFGSHAGYTVGLRQWNVKQGEMQATKYEDNRGSVENARAEVIAAEKRIADLQWVPATATIAGLETSISVKQEAIRQEERRGGCGPVCLRLRTEVVPLQQQLGALNDRASLEARIAENKAWLENARKRAGTTDAGRSDVDEHNKFFARMFTWELNPDSSSLTWAQIVVGLVMALGATSFAPGALTLAFALGRGKLELFGDEGGGDRSRKPSSNNGDNTNTLKLVIGTEDKGSDRHTASHTSHHTTTIEKIIEKEKPITNIIEHVPNARRIARVQDTMFARRVAAVTKDLRQATVIDINQVNRRVLPGSKKNTGRLSAWYS